MSRRQMELDTAFFTKLNVEGSSPFKAFSCPPTHISQPSLGVDDRCPEVGFYFSFTLAPTDFFDHGI